MRDAKRRDGFTVDDAKEDRRVVGFHILVQTLRDERTTNERTNEARACVNEQNFFKDETVRELFVSVDDECDDDE